MLYLFQVVNAEQFTLPSELEPHESLPFDWKWAEERQDDFDAYPKVKVFNHIKLLTI